MIEDLRADLGPYWPLKLAGCVVLAVAALYGLMVLGLGLERVG